MVNADFEVRHYLSWIEELTTNQYVGGSNPSWRTTFSQIFLSLFSPQDLAHEAYEVPKGNARQSQQKARAGYR